MPPVYEMKTSPAQASIQLAADLILRSRYTVVLTGAGISTPSGIPDFRSANSGQWTKLDPMEVASYSAFRYRPEKFFDWLRPLAGRIWDAQPNSAHLSLARLENAGHIQAVITQNIDGLHQKAGSREVIEVHGSMNRMYCPGCHSDYPSQEYYRQFVTAGGLPRCHKCHLVLKPDIVLFEEMLPQAAWNRAMDHSQNADLFVVIGSSLQVTPAADLPLTALRAGSKLIINTFSTTYLDGRANALIRLDVTEAIPAITELVLKSSDQNRS